MQRVPYGALGAILVSGLLACAEGKPIGPQGNPDARIGDNTDGAPRADAGPTIDSGGGGGARTLTQSATSTITNANSIACASQLDGTTQENHYYRVFDLATEGVNGSFAVTQVSFGVESAVAGAGGTQPGTVTLYTLNGAFQVANLTQLGSADITIADVNANDAGTGTVQDVPITASAPAGSKLVVELLTPDGTTDGNTLYVGSNADAETAPTFMRAPGCSIMQPTAAGDVDPSGANMHWVLSVTGTVGP